MGLCMFRHSLGSHFFERNFRPLPGIKKIHHFIFSLDNTGMVFYKIKTNDDEQMFDLLWNRSGAVLGDNPSVIDPPGLPHERQLYLFNKIREFVKEEVQDVVCPQTNW